MYLGKNTLVSGGTGSGKTTMLNVLGSRMPKTQRLLIIEDSAELQIKAEHVVQFETRKANPKLGITEVSIRDLVESALRLRPDRIIVGEVRAKKHSIFSMPWYEPAMMDQWELFTLTLLLIACTRLETLCLMGETKSHQMLLEKWWGLLFN